MRKVLVANRGEIAVRVLRACADLGLATVAVYSDSDEGALHVRLAGEAVRLPGDAARDTYLSIPKLIEAARRTGAGLVHPGYGFLSESAAFARACSDAGLVFVGPNALAIEAMGDKARAKAVAERAGVPTIPGYSGGGDAAVLLSKAAGVGFPLLVKAAAGGGGRGMRFVAGPDGLEAALVSAAREAERAFGSGALILERDLEPCRHVEVQVLGDRHGNLIHLFERDCSLQRRHQKIVEESPAPGLSLPARKALWDSALKLAALVGYDSAGTVEFLVDSEGRHYFLEMNTRIQVEHPVTEVVTGVDLVRWQLRVALGEKLTLAQSDVRVSGHAVEARLYAEDPERGFIPVTGEVERWRPPTGEGVRVDSALETGARVTPHYDGMLAKIVASGATRDEALDRLERAIESTVVLGLPTNREFLLAVLSDPEVRAERVHTKLVEARREAWSSVDEARQQRLLVAATAWYALTVPAPRKGIPPGFSNNFRRVQSVWWEGVGEVGYLRSAAGIDVSVNSGGKPYHCRALAESAGEWWLEIDGVAEPFHCIRRGTRLEIRGARDRRVIEKKARPCVAGVSRRRELAPLSGRVARVLAAAGASVRAGEPLIVLEAMKMEHTVPAEADGRVAEIFVREGDSVTPGAPLVRIEAE